MDSEPKPYILETNGVVEGPLSVKDILWKVSAAQPDDVLRMRRTDSTDWSDPRLRLSELVNGPASEEKNPPRDDAPPKLKLRLAPRKTDQAGNEMPPPALAQPGAARGEPEPSVSQEYTDENPPPPPPFDAFVEPDTAPPPPPESAGVAAAGATGMPSGSSAHPATQPTPPPWKALLIVSAALTACIAGYVLLLMRQPVMANITGGTSEISTARYFVFTESQADAWKKATRVRMDDLGERAAREAAESAAKHSELLADTDDVVARFRAGIDALRTVVTNARRLKGGFDTGDRNDVRRHLELEAALDIASPYLDGVVWRELENRNYASIMQAALINGLSQIEADYQKRIAAVESKLRQAEDSLSITHDASQRYVSELMYSPTPGTEMEAEGAADRRGRFETDLRPGDYYVVASSTDTVNGRRFWGVPLKVKPLEDNLLFLEEDNEGYSSQESLWKPEDAQKVEDGARKIRRQMSEIRKRVAQIQELTLLIRSRKQEMSLLSD